MFNQIKYFIAVVKNKNFTKAAEECNISQPAISQQIKELEAMLGTQLLERKGRSFTLTKAGKYFYNHSQDVLNNVEILIEETQKIGNQKIEPYVLHAGYLRNFGTREFLKAVEEFSKEYPDIKLNITNGSHEKLYLALEDNKLDIALNDLRRAPSEKYINKFLITSGFEVVVNKKLVDFNQTKIQMKDLVDLPCILVVSPSEQADEEYYYRDILGVGGDFLITNTYEQAFLMVTLCQGYLVINNRTKDQIPHNSEVISLPLYNGGEKMEQKYYAFWKADNSGYYVESFFDILKKQFE
ncbi:LysR family transcriptional regulator [Lactobacillus sp. LL6]|uniref:LysR family transcriptional regulator n=1 Tax=Lactobacillus sp. LL6 TaxID=2596827 RepID=UPI0011859EC6|nr:LysR family transcriptional regulator [Lactobacillus sp. LL6]TSO26394.1 LysR family transcriptional regulator [Lactobacillus sp. LL6]